MKENIVNVGLIGLGRIGKMHAKNIYQRLPFLNLKSVADPKPDVEFIQDIGRVNSFEKPEKIIFDQNIDAVVISSPTPTHFDLINKCIENNKKIKFL